MHHIRRVSKGCCEAIIPCLTQYHSGHSRFGWASVDLEVMRRALGEKAMNIMPLHRLVSGSPSVGVPDSIVLSFDPELACLPSGE